MFIQPLQQNFLLKEFKCSYASVHITFEYGKCVVTCTNGMCCVQMHNKKKIPKSAKVENAKGLCPHVQTIAIHINAVKSYFPEYFASHIEMTDEMNPEEEDTDNNPLLYDNIQGNFDVQNGLWNFHSLTQFKPKDMMDPELIKHTKTRIITVLEENSCVQLKPNPYNNKTLKMCDCGAGYSPDTEYIPKWHSMLYMRISPVKCEFFNLPCHNGICELKFEDVAEQQGICFTLKVTCAGDEIGWDFVQDVITKRTSFKAYCDDMT